MPTSVVIRHPTPADEREFIAKARRSRALHRPWMKPPTTRAQFRRFLDDARDERRRTWLVCVRGRGEIAGVVNVSEIVLGSFRSAYLGYYVFAGFERRGLMRAGLKAVSSLVSRRAPPQARGQYPADEPRIAGARRVMRIREGRLLAALPEDPRPVARPLRSSDCRFVKSVPRRDRQGAMLAGHRIGES
jgi:Acetyltransferase (GNAT) domain